ncbi:MAG TPA: ACT domain-containing protein [Candidatus Acidoferrales bacterium]|nr:ACT domain-containing protein [Candidatus Acidoferrales bacterium]
MCYPKRVPERDLQTLLITMKPALDPREWVFCCVDRSFPIAEVRPLLTFRETEGITIVVERLVAEEYNLDYAFPSSRITLRAESDLESVGFTATVTAALSKHTIATNVVSGFYHDHIFVPLERGEEALRVLEELSAQSARRLL